MAFFLHFNHHVRFSFQFFRSISQAHGEGRKAERLLRSGKYEKAIGCHERAVGHLAQAMTQCHLDTVQQSLSGQRDHHLRQVQLLCLNLLFLIA